MTTPEPFVPAVSRASGVREKRFAMLGPIVANAKAIYIFFSKNISVYAIFNNQRFNDTLTEYIISFEQLGLN